MSSRKTSTTQRRQNLLKSVMLRGSRNMTSGLFRVGEQTLTEISMKTGRAKRGSYFIVRDELRKVLTDAHPISVINTYRNGRAGASIFHVHFLEDNGLSIGCKEFRGKAALALREWALYGQS